MSRPHQRPNSVPRWVLSGAGVLLVLGAGPAEAAVLVQQAEAQSSSTSQQLVTLPAPVAPGDMLVVDAISQSSRVTSVTGGGIGAWTNAGEGYADGGCGTCLRGALWYGLNSAGGSSTVTVNFSGGFNVIVRVSEWSGVVTAGALESASVLAPGFNRQVVATNTLVPASGDLMVWAMEASDQLTLLSGATGGFTDGGLASQASFTAQLASAWMLSPDAGGVASSWTLAASTRNWLTIIAAFKVLPAVPDAGAGDAGSSQDAGTPADAGVPVDGGGGAGLDGGPSVDGGPPPDGGVDESPGFPRQLAVGFGCAQGESGAPFGFWLLVVGFILLAWRSRRAS